MLPIAIIRIEFVLHRNDYYLSITSSLVLFADSCELSESGLAGLRSPTCKFVIIDQSFNINLKLDFFILL